MSAIKTWAAWHAIVIVVCASLSLSVQAQQAQPAGGAVRKIGTVKSINGSTLVLKTDAGPEVNVTVPDSARILRLAPGQTDLKTATPAKLSDLQVGDRMLLRASSEGDPLPASIIVLMKQGDVTHAQQQQMQDWQKRGVGGIVTAIDAANNALTVTASPTVSFVIKTTPSTVFMRYADNSVKYADAHKGTFADIKTGDQLRARGQRDADNKEVSAEEIISGTFRNIAGTVSAIDTANNAITVKDILAKKTVVVKIGQGTQMRKLPPQLAQRIAFFLKGGPGGNGPGGQTTSANGAPPAGGPGGGPSASGGPGGGQRGPGGGGMDFQQIIGRLPAVTVEELQKEDAVMIVSTAGSGSEVEAITLLSGVEPILTASPNGMSAAALLSGWNISAPGGEGGPQ